MAATGSSFAKSLGAVASDDAMHSKKRDVIIIGGGLSGLSAAKELRARGLDVLVLEARDRIGGRTFTGREDNGKFWVDYGAAYVGPTQRHVLNLIEELKLETYLVEDSLDIGYLSASSKDERFVDYRARFNPQHEDVKLGNIIHWLDYVNMVRLIDSMGKQIPPEAPWKAKKAREWDSINFRDFVRQNTWTKRVRDFFNYVFVTIDVCCDSEEVSLLWFLWYVRGCGGYGRTIATTNGGQERKVKGGTMQMSERLLEIVGRQRVLLNKPVVRLDQSEAVFASITTADGQTFKADHVIMATSPHLWLKVHHEPALPPAKNLLAQRSPMGQVAKVILYYERPFWKDHGFSGCFIIQSDKRDLHPIILTLDDTKLDGSHAAVIGFMTARGWFAMREKSDSEIAKTVARSYAQTSGLKEFLDFKKIRMFDWTREQYSGGCYGTSHGLNTLTKYGEALRQPHGRIFYAGTETATVWSGYMDGAISAGKRAAREILHSRGLLEKSQIWLDNEPEPRLVPDTSFDYPSSYRYAPTISGLLWGFTNLLVVSGLSYVAYKRLCIGHLV